MTTIKELIASLERRAELSDHGFDAKVSLRLHTLEHNGSGFSVAAEIDDISNSWGPGEDVVEIECILSDKKITDLNNQKEVLVKL